MISHLPQRAAWSAAATMPIAAMEMSRHLAGWPNVHGASLMIWLYIAATLATAVVFIAGWPLIQKGLVSYRTGKLNMFSLIMPGVLITYAYSMLALISPGMFPENFHEHGRVPVYFEAAAMITTLVLLGQWLEHRAEHRAGDALTALANLAPTRALIVRDAGEISIPVGDIIASDMVQLRAGDRIPVDGPIEHGVIAVDESMITGEALPVTKSPGSTVVAGTMVVEGAAIQRAENTGDKTVLAHIVQMVRAAQTSKAPIQRVADRVTGKLVPLVIGIAVLTFFIWWIWGPAPSLWFALLHAVTVLMITCPCALGLATPVSIIAGIGRGATGGILIKQAASLEKLASIRTVVLDKTGTLTTGRPALLACRTVDDTREHEMLAYAASLEKLSRHPLAEAIVESARIHQLDMHEVTDFRSQTGGGVAGRIGGRIMAIGRRDWLTAQGVRGFEHFLSFAAENERHGRTVVWLAMDGMVSAALALSDTLKPDAAAAMDGLKSRGLRLMMMTGDQRGAAEAVARTLAIDTVHADVKPGDKERIIKEQQALGDVVAMAGDGINDAPALASADVGISIGTGTDVAVASGDINLMHGHLMDLVRAIDLSRATMRNIKQNLFFAFAYNTLMIPVAAGALYPWTGWVLTPMLASVAMTVSSLTVIGNALRLRRVAL